METRTDILKRRRRPTPARIAKLRESIAELGDLRDYFPVLLDTEGNIVDGNVRRAIDPAWPASPDRVPPAAAIAAAAAANRSNAWSEREWEERAEARTVARLTPEIARRVAEAYRLPEVMSYAELQREISRRQGDDDE